MLFTSLICFSSQLKNQHAEDIDTLDVALAKAEDEVAILSAQNKSLNAKLIKQERLFHALKDVLEYVEELKKDDSVAQAPKPPGRTQFPGLDGLHT